MIIRTDSSLLYLAPTDLDFDMVRFHQLLLRIFTLFLNFLPFLNQATNVIITALYPTSMKKERKDVKEAEKYIQTLSKRLALLHLSYAETLTEELGEDRGKQMAVKAIKRYGRYIGEARREEIVEEGIEPTPETFSEGTAFSIPPFGMHSKIEEGEDTMKAYGCVLSELWSEYGKEDLGRLYCFVDPAKYMAFNEDHIQIHMKAKTVGDDHCEFEIRPSTEEEKQIFKEDKRDFSKVDEYLKED